MQQLTRLLLALPLLAPSDAAAKKVSCHSAMGGDFEWEACSPFCKEAKAANHCQFCKCKQCPYCSAGNYFKPGTERVSLLPQAGTPAQPGQSAAAPAVPKAFASPGHKTKCSSGKKGDYQFEACGAFCKEAKAANHCQFCKCKSCNFCSARKSSTPPSEQSAAAAAVPKLPAPKKEKRHKKERKKKSQTLPTAAASDAADSGALLRHLEKKKCFSGMKGDFQFETCGAFCKASKKENHCKFCKCKQCGFCGASGDGAASTPAAPAPRALPTTPAHGSARSLYLSPTTAAATTPAETQASGFLPALESEAGRVGSVGGAILLLIVLCALMAFCADFDLCRRLRGSSPRRSRDEGEAFLSGGHSFEIDEQRMGEGLHHGLDDAFRSVEKLEAKSRS